MTNSELIQEVINNNEHIVEVCKDQLRKIGNPDNYSYCHDHCNSIVINKERMMTVTTDENNRTTYEFNTLCPTYFPKSMAEKIVKNDIYMDINGNRIKMEIIGEKEYYTMLLAKAEKALELFKGLSDKN